MTLEEKPLFDFMYCPLYFYTKYALQIPMDNTPVLSYSILNVIKYFYVGLFDGQVRTYKQLQAKWDSIAADTILDAKQLIAGWQKIVRIVEWSKAHRIIIADLNCKYTFSSSSHTIEGKIDFILVYPNQEIELLYFDLSERHLNPLEEHKKLKYALDFFGFEKIYDKKPDRVKIYHPKYEEESILQFTQADEQRLTSIIQNAGECIRQKLYVPREGYMCTSCLAKSYCRYFYNQ